MAAPNIYHFHPVTGVMTGIGSADPSPKEPGVWIVPAYATRETPPEVPSGQIAVRDGDSWTAAEDHRGEVHWINGMQVTIDEIGPLPAGISEAPPEAGEGQEVVWQNGAWAILADHRGEIWYTGPNAPFIVDFLGDPAQHGLVSVNPAIDVDVEELPPLERHLTKRQVNAALILAGQVDPDAFVEAAIALIGDATQRALALNDWRYAPYYERNHPLFNDPAMLAATGLSEPDIDGLWLTALGTPV